MLIQILPFPLKHDRRADFYALAATAGLRAGVAEAAAEELTEDMRKMITEVLDLRRRRTTLNRLPQDAGIARNENR